MATRTSRRLRTDSSHEKTHMIGRSHRSQSPGTHRGPAHRNPQLQQTNIEKRSLLHLMPGLLCSRPGQHVALDRVAVLLFVALNRATVLDFVAQLRLQLRKVPGLLISQG